MRHGASWSGRLAVFVALAAASAGLVAAVSYASATSGGQLEKGATITSVTFSGTPASPTVTVVGRGLVVPAPSPKVSPSNQPLCPKRISGNAGLDYGVGLYLSAFSDDKQKYSAGRYRPARNELDCIGLVVLSHSATKIRFRFGAAYRQADFGYAPIRNGDLVEVVVGNAAFGLVVRYR